MKILEHTPDVLKKANVAFDTNAFFEPLSDAQRDQVIAKAGTIELYDDNEFILKTGDDADFLFVIISGAVGIIVNEGEDQIEITTLESPQMVGEIALILNEKRTAGCQAKGETIILKLAREVFQKVLTAIPEAGRSMMHLLAERLKNAAKPQAHMDYRGNAKIPPVDVLRLLPIAFMQRHRVAPVKKNENKLLLGHCEPIDESLMESIRKLIPAMIINPVSMDTEYFNNIIIFLII